MFALLVTWFCFLDCAGGSKPSVFVQVTGCLPRVALLTTTKFYEFGTKFKFLWGLVSIITYSMAVLIWLWYFSIPVKAEPPRAEQPPLSAQEMGRYKEIVRRVRRP